LQIAHPDCQVALAQKLVSLPRRGVTLTQKLVALCKNRFVSAHKFVAILRDNIVLRDFVVLSTDGEVRRAGVGCDDILDISVRHDPAMLEHNAAITPFAQQVHRVRCEHEYAGAPDEPLCAFLCLVQKAGVASR
jgi:hypothetical protein